MCAIFSLRILSQLNQHMHCQNKANTFLTGIKRKQNMVVDIQTSRFPYWDSFLRGKI